MFHTLDRRSIVVLVILWLLPLSGLGQLDTTNSSRGAREDITTPVASGVLGHKDIPALKEIADHIAATGLKTWTAFQGEGQIIYDGEKANPASATLSNSGGYQFRLDVTTSKGTSSVRIDHGITKKQDLHGVLTTTPSDSSIFTLFPFEVVRTMHELNKNISIRDLGTVQLAGLTLHEVSLERATLGSNPRTKLPNTMVIDLYFDPTTHLLMRSAVLVPALGIKNPSLLSVVTYGDYRKMEGCLIPFRFEETLSGEAYRSLQLSSAQLHPKFDTAYFSF